MRTLIAIPVYNEEQYVPRVLASVIEHAPGGPGDILVIDDGSTDRTADRIRATRSRPATF